MYSCKRVTITCRLDAEHARLSTEAGQPHVALWLDCLQQGRLVGLQGSQTNAQRHACPVDNLHQRTVAALLRVGDNCSPYIRTVKQLNWDEEITGPKQDIMHEQLVLE